MLIPNKHNGYTRDGVRRAYFGGGGGGGSTTATQYTSNVPEYAKGEFMDLVGKASALSNAPYQAYTGERTAQFTPLQQQAFNQAGQQQVAGQIGFGTGLAGLAGTSSFTQPGTAGAFMSPFIGQALAPQLRELSRQADIQGTQQQAQATQRGAFGGSRDAIMRAERERNLMQQQGDVLSKGYQTAYEQAAQQYNAEQAQRLQAASALGQLGQQQFGQEMDITKLQTELGGQQRQAVQDVLNQQYADFQAQKDYPYQQLGFLSDILRGAGGSTRSVYPGPSNLQTLAGLGTAAYGASKLFKEGGEVQGYADGGITGLLGDQQLAQRAQQAPTPMGQMAAQQEMAQRAQLRQAAAAQAPQQAPAPTEDELIAAYEQAAAQGDKETADRILQMLTQMRAVEEAGLAAIAPDNVAEFADGGIVAFAGGGDIERILSKGPYERTPEENAMLEQAGYKLERRTLPKGSWVDRLNTALTPATPTPAAPAYVGPDTGDDSQRLLSRYPAPASGLAAAAPAPGPTPKAAPEAKAPAGIGALPSGQYPFDAAAEERAAVARSEAVSSARRAAAEADIEDLVAEQKARGVYGEGREQRHKEGLAAIENDKDRAVGTSILRAGLAILAADPSKGGFAAIGSGATAGLDAYANDMEKLQTRKDALQSKLDELEDIRRQEATADAKDMRLLKSARRQVEVEGAKDIQAIGNEIGLKIKPQIADSVFKEINANNRAALSARTSLEAAKLSAGKSTIGGVPRELVTAFTAAQERVRKTLDAMPQYKYRGEQAPGYAEAYQSMLRREVANNPFLAEYADQLIGAPTGAGGGSAGRMKFDARGNPIK